jgi:hypothetical protein
LLLSSGVLYFFGLAINTHNMDGDNFYSTSTALPYTSSPPRLLGFEATLIWTIFRKYPQSFLGVLRPFWSWKPEDELCLLSIGNVFSLVLHFILIVAQALFLASVVCLPLLWPILPAFVYLGGIVSFLIVNWAVCKLLNGFNEKGEQQYSNIDLSPYPEREGEFWIFINGVSVGYVWPHLTKSCGKTNSDAESIGFRTISTFYPRPLDAEFKVYII